MFCEKCGKEIKDGDKFCPYCGAENKINKEDPSHDIPPDFSAKGTGKKKKRSGYRDRCFSYYCGDRYF